MSRRMRVLVALSVTIGIAIGNEVNTSGLSCSSCCMGVDAIRTHLLDRHQQRSIQRATRQNDNKSDQAVNIITNHAAIAPSHSQPTTTSSPYFHSTSQTPSLSSNSNPTSSLSSSSSPSSSHSHRFVSPERLSHYHSLTTPVSLLSLDSSSHDFLDTSHLLFSFPSIPLAPSTPPSSDPPTAGAGAAGAAGTPGAAGATETSAAAEPSFSLPLPPLTPPVLIPPINPISTLNPFANSAAMAAQAAAAGAAPVFAGQLPINVPFYWPHPPPYHVEGSSWSASPSSSSRFPLDLYPSPLIYGPFGFPTPIDPTIAAAINPNPKGEVADVGVNQPYSFPQFRMRPATAIGSPTSTSAASTTLLETEQNSSSGGRLYGARGEASGCEGCLFEDEIVSAGVSGRSFHHAAVAGDAVDSKAMLLELAAIENAEQQFVVTDAECEGCTFK